MSVEGPPGRRHFLRAGAGGLASALGLCACSRPESSSTAPQGGGKPIIRTLGRTGLRLPIVSMGTAYAVNLVHSALAGGIRYIHTSSSYAERNHERLLGRVFRGRARDSFVVATSPDLPYRDDPTGIGSLDIGTTTDVRLFEESLDGSLQRLGLDGVDIYYLPSIGRRETAKHEPYLKAFEALKKAGKARFVGVTTHGHEPEVIRAAVEAGVWDVVLTSYNFRQSHREEVRAAIQHAADAGLGIVAMKTQAGVYWDASRTRKINMKAALKWVLRNESVHTTIPAISNFDELREDLSVMEDPTLTPDERKDLGLGSELGLSGLYCQQCGECRPQCPAGLDIPTLMRGYMYAAGHQQPSKARFTLSGWTRADLTCRTCEHCDVRCALGFDVRSRALQMADLLDDPDAPLGGAGLEPRAGSGPSPGCTHG
jgi:predicted aldo/keto reductase-like oxidoreductase